MRGHARNRRYDQAISDFTRTLEIHPRYAWAYSNRGTVHTDTGRYDQAIVDFTKALELDPGYAALYDNRTRAYYSLKGHDKSWDDVRRAQQLGVKIDPTFLKDLRESSGREE
jgi:tetratricopeptide (TPR) repeat protein